MRAKLLAVGGTVKPVEIALCLPTIIGRGHSATLRLPHPLISRKHCELFERDDELVVRDLGSLNGTFVGNQRVTEATIPPGELLTVGTITFRAIYTEDSDSDATDPAPACRPKERSQSTEAGIASADEKTEHESGGDANKPLAQPVDRKTTVRPPHNSDSADDSDSADSFFDGAT